MIFLSRKNRIERGKCMLNKKILKLILNGSETELINMHPEGMFEDPVEYEHISKNGWTYSNKIREFGN